VRQIHVNGVELRLRGGDDGAGHAQVIAAGAGAHFHARHVKIRSVFGDDAEHHIGELILGLAHDLDWKMAGKLKQGIFVGSHFSLCASPCF
jgi:hypothetical protein